MTAPGARDFEEAIYALGRSLEEEPATADQLSFWYRWNFFETHALFHAPFGFGPAYCLPPDRGGDTRVALLHTCFLEQAARAHREAGLPDRELEAGLVARLTQVADAPAGDEAGRQRRAYAVAALLERLDRVRDEAGVDRRIEASWEILLAGDDTRVMVGLDLMAGRILGGRPGPRLPAGARGRLAVRLEQLKLRADRGLADRIPELARELRLGG